jgi:hypothetical protein
MKIAHAVLVLSLFGAFSAHADLAGGSVSCDHATDNSFNSVSQAAASSTVNRDLNQAQGTQQAPAPKEASGGAATPGG